MNVPGATPTPDPAASPGAPAKVVLSTVSVYPESTASGFELASSLGWDGVEVMVGIDPVASDIDYVEKLRDYHEVAVHAIHAPCLLVTQTTWGNDPWEKLSRSVQAAERLGADTVVVHPPFRWQRDYAKGFVAGVKRMNQETEITIAVENMYPWRTPAGRFQAYQPDWDPTDLDYDDLTLDLSHAATARKQSLDYVRAWGDRLRHVHLTDGSGSLKDEHLLPGEGNQQAWTLVETLAAQQFTGQIVLEVNSRRARSRAARAALLGECLVQIREHLGQPVSERTRAAVAQAEAEVTPDEVVVATASSPGTAQ